MMIRLPMSAVTDAGPRHVDEGAARLRTDRVLASDAMGSVRYLLERLGHAIDPEPIVRKQVTERHLRLMFPVSGRIVDGGTVVAVVSLYDCASETTLYVHPMHAGPGVNPLLNHGDGPMALPKSQAGADGDRATERLIQHKRALWRRFERERVELGAEEASVRWRRDYYRALKRLYFCNRCSGCRWGSPFFDGPDPTAAAISTRSAPFGDEAYAGRFGQAVDDVVASALWQVERAYARRGGFELREVPRLVRTVSGGLLQMIFPTDARVLQGGSIVGASAYYAVESRETLFIHCIAAGPEADIQWLSGDRSLGLPVPEDDVTGRRDTYRQWREEAWSSFWLDELDFGLVEASRRWLERFWVAVERYVGGTPESGERIGAGGNGSARVCADEAVAGESERTLERALPTRVPLETLDNLGGRCFAGHAARTGSPVFRAKAVRALMVNLGKRCNQVCGHCHIDAGPHREEEMSRETIEQVLSVLRTGGIETLDITGGAPELHPHFRYLVAEASARCARIIDRCNLTVLLENGQEDTAAFLARHGVEITASLPSWDPEEVNAQRGREVFSLSIEALLLLNSLGYGKPESGLLLNLVFNPTNEKLAPSQAALHKTYARELGEQYGVTFNCLYAMNNMPVNRFRDYLRREGALDRYARDLVAAFNPATVHGYMCRESLSVSWDGRLYDCDFHHAASRPLLDGLPSHIGAFDPDALSNREINTAGHCFGCAAGFGSSCHGALAEPGDPRDTRVAAFLDLHGCAPCEGEG